MKKTLLIVCMLILSTFGLPAQNDLTFKPYTFSNNIGEKVEAELGTLSVPENRTAPSDKRISLSFVRFKSMNPNPGSPIVYLAGGPGGSGIATAKGARFKLFMALREVADVIAFDQRGTGRSNQIPPCSKRASFPLDVPGSAAYYTGKIRETTKECMDFWNEQGVDIGAYNTRENAQDLEDLRKALEVPTISLWGISYGSHLGFEFIKSFESNVDKVVLASLEGPDHTIKLPSYTDDFLKMLSRQLAADREASVEYPNLLGMMRTVHQRLRNKPVRVKTKDPRSGASLEVAVSEFDVQLVTSFVLMKNPSDSKNLPRAYKKMLDGNFTELALTVAGLRQFAGRVQAMPFAMDVASGVSAKRWKRVLKEADKAILGRTTNFPFPDAGLNLGLPDLGDDFRKNPRSSINALFFSGTLDGRTYLASARELVKGFKNGKHVIIEGAGHDLFMTTPEVEKIMLSFFKGEPVKSQKISVEVPAFTLMK